MSREPRGSQSEGRPRRPSISAGEDESGVLEGRATAATGSMSTPRRVRVRGPGSRRPQSIYAIPDDHDPWADGRITWTKGGEETLNELLRTATVPPIDGFWKRLQLGDASTAVGEWFKEQNQGRAASAFRYLIQDYNRVMNGWINSLRTTAGLNKSLTNERLSVGNLSAQVESLRNRNYKLEDTVGRNEEYIDGLEMARRDQENQIKELNQQLKLKQAENRRLTQTLNSKRSQQTTPGGTVIDDGGDGHCGTTWSEDISRKEREDYLFNITQANERADAKELEVRELKATIERLRAGQEAIDQAGDHVTSTSVSAAATALKATEEKYQDLIGELTNENSSLKHTLAALQTAIREMTTGNEETLKREKEKLQTECQALRGQLSSQWSEMSGNIQKAAQDLKDLQGKYDKLKRRAAEYEKKIRRLEIDKDNEINRLRQQVDSVEKSVEKSAPKFNQLEQWINLSAVANDQPVKKLEKSQEFLQQVDEHLKENATPSPGLVKELATCVKDIFNSVEKIRDNHEQTREEAKETREEARVRAKDLQGINKMLLGWRSRVQFGLVSPTALRHEGDMIASTLERLQHQHREQQNAKGDDSDVDVSSERRRSQHITPSKEPKPERPPPVKPVDKERAREATLVRNRERRDRRDRVPQRPPSALVFVDKPSSDRPVAVAGTGKSEEATSPKPAQPQLEAPPTNYPFEHEITSSEKDRIHDANAPKSRAASKPQEPLSSKEGESPSSKGPLSSRGPPSSEEPLQANLEEVPLLDDDFDPTQLRILRGYMNIVEIKQGVTDEDRRKPDNSFLGAVVRSAEKEAVKVLDPLFVEIEDPPPDLFTNPDHKTHRFFWVCKLHDILHNHKEKVDFDKATARSLLRSLDECEQQINLQITSHAASPEWQHHLIEEFEGVFVKDANERHEQATELRTKYDELETELLEAELSPAEEFYVLNCVKRHLDRGNGEDSFEDLVWEIAPIIDRENKLGEVTQELSEWVKEHEDWSERMTPQYINPLLELKQLLKDNIADVHDTDNKIRLQTRLERVEAVLRNLPLEELLLKNTLKSPLEIITANIRVNQDAINDQYETRRQRIESLVREKAFELYSTNSHSKHAESACFCSLLKYFAPRLYYSALRDGCCGYGRMVSSIKEGTNVDTQPVHPESDSTFSTRRGRICQGHHGHGLLSASTTLPTVLCHVLTSILWLILFILSTPWEIYATLVVLFTIPFDLLSYSLTWVKYYFSYLHWYLFPNNYAENYLTPTNSFQPQSSNNKSGGDEPEPEPERRPSIDIFAFKDPNPVAASSSSGDHRSEDGAGDDRRRRPPPPPPEKPGPFRLSRHTASPASLLISLSIITTIFSSVVYLAVDQERRIWLSNNHWRRVFVNDMLEPFGTLETRARAWVNWGVVAFPANAVARALNRVFVHFLPRDWTLVPWDTERAVVGVGGGGGTGGTGYGGITWGDRAGLGGLGQSQAVEL